MQELAADQVSDELSLLVLQRQIVIFRQAGLSMGPVSVRSSRGVDGFGGL
jgi:hypothetical protein